MLSTSFREHKVLEEMWLPIPGAGDVTCKKPTQTATQTEVAESRKVKRSFLAQPRLSRAQRRATISTLSMDQDGYR